MSSSSSPRKQRSSIEKFELGMDVPIEIALKRLLICSQRNDWAGCEQAMRYV